MKVTLSSTFSRFKFGNDFDEFWIEVPKKDTGYFTSRSRKMHSTGEIAMKEFYADEVAGNIS